MNSALEQVAEEIKRHKIIAIVRKVAPKDVIPLAQALYEGGVRLIEVTFDQANPDSALETSKMIRSLSDNFAGRLTVGAGTVVTPEQVDVAESAGARFIISPNFDVRVVKRTNGLGIVSIPGAMTPTEILAAYDTGADFVKVFPVESLGVGYIKAIKAPINHVPLLAVGGVDVNNLKDFLAAGISGVGIGSNIVDKRLLREGNFAKLSELAKAFTSQIEKED